MDWKICTSGSNPFISEVLQPYLQLVGAHFVEILNKTGQDMCTPPVTLHHPGKPGVIPQWWNSSNKNERKKNTCIQD